MNWDIVITLAIIFIACIYCGNKLFRRKSACTSCGVKNSCADYYNHKEIITKCVVKTKE